MRAWRQVAQAAATVPEPRELRPGGWVPDEDWRQIDGEEPPVGRPPRGLVGPPAEPVPIGAGVGSSPVGAGAGVAWWHGRWGWLVDRLPPALRSASVAPSRRAASALALVALAVAASTGWLLLRNTPKPAIVSAPSVARTLPVRTASPSPVRVVLVDVAGKVRRPGVVRLPLGSRVGDALRAAGGVPPGVDIGLLNLARPLTDGEQVIVGLGTGEPAPASPGASGGAGSAGGSPVELNAATLADLDGLPGVGPVLAQRIVEWRTAHGPFTSVEQLRDVPGIGDRKFEDLRARVRV